MVGNIHFLMISYAKPLNALAATAHSIPGDPAMPFPVSAWQMDPDSDDWQRVKFRMADDTADFYGHPYLIGYMSNKYADGNTNHFIHFHRWQSLGALVLLLGDEDGRDYPFKSEQLVGQVAMWWSSSQAKWCDRYHTGCPPERHVAEEHDSLQSLISAISAGKTR